MQKAHKNLSGITKEFSRFAHSYGKYNVIQSKVVSELILMIERKKIETLLDVGCGSGAVYQALKREGYQIDRFLALDASKEMLQRHPNAETVEKVCMDFNSPSELQLPKESVIVSSSALQWSRDLEKTLSWLSSLGQEAYFAIFTANTFKTLHHTAGIASPIYSAQKLKEILDRYYDAEYTLREYVLSFDSTREIFRYIKKSGVSGGVRQLSYKETKMLMNQYPLSYLEFEVLFVKGHSKTPVQR